MANRPSARLARGEAHGRVTTQAAAQPTTGIQQVNKGCLPLMTYPSAVDASYWSRGKLLKTAHQ
jgi:hypothetical protein